MENLPAIMAQNMRKVAFYLINIDNNKADIYFAIARLYDSLSYGSDMQTSALTAIEDSKTIINDCIERMEKELK